MSERDDRARAGITGYLIGFGLVLATGVLLLVYLQRSVPTAVAVLEFGGDGGEEVSAALREALGQSFDVIAPESQLQGESAEDLLRDRAGSVVAGELPQTRRFQAVHAYLHEPDGRRLIWSDSLHYSAVRPYAARIAGDIAQAVHSNGDGELEPRFFPAIEAQEEYLAGRLELDKPSARTNLDQARARFESALSAAPEYAKARAGLCEALLQLDLIGDESLLEQAEKECQAALGGEPPPAEALTAWGNLLRETDRLDEAKTAFDKALKRDAYHTDAYLGLALTHARLHQADGSEEAAEQAVQRAQQAVDTYQYFWKSAYVLSRIHEDTGDLRAAIDAGEEAKTLEANAQVLEHLGSLYLCEGKYSRALSNFEKAGEASASTRIDAGAGAARYFLGEHEEAAGLLRNAATRAEDAGHPIDHRLWAYLGDSLRQIDKDTEAVQAYEKAATAVDDDRSADQGAYRAYYHAALAHLDAARKSQESSREIETWLRGVQDHAGDTAALRRIAEAWTLMRQMIPARAAYDKLRLRCRGYTASPDLAILKES